MTLESWLRFGHILGAIAWLGGGLMLSVIGSRARASADPGAIGEFGRTLAWAGPRVLVPGVLAVLVFGVWMILISSAWDFSQAWVLIALGLFAASFLIGVLVLSRLGIRLGNIGDGAVPPSDGPALLDRWLLGYRVVLVILLVAVWDMVFKPGM